MDQDSKQGNRTNAKGASKVMIGLTPAHEFSASRRDSFSAAYVWMAAQRDVNCNHSSLVGVRDTHIHISAAELSTWGGRNLLDLRDNLPRWLDISLLSPAGNAGKD